MNKWVRIEDELPDDETILVLVYCVYKACIECDVAYLSDDDIFLDEKHNEPLPVTHWQYLPEPPENNNESNRRR